MKRILIVTGGVFFLAFTGSVLAQGEPREKAFKSPASTVPADITPEQRQKGAAAFLEVYRVLQHPRCLNCHPNGDAPLQNDDSRPHAMNITRQSVSAGLECATCHQEANADDLSIPNGPPGAPNWHLPDKDMPLIFQDRTPEQLCKQLKAPTENGNKTLLQLFNHIAYDPLVLWGWDPGGDRSKPPLSHPEFVAEFRTWIDSGAACPSTE